MTNLDSIFKNRDITLPTKVHLVKAMVFPVVMYGCGQGQRPEGDTPCPKPEAKGGVGEEQTHDQGQGGWPGGSTPHARSRGCAGAGGPTGAIPH